MKHFDALGNPIVERTQLYGYTTSTNSVGEINIGQVIKLNNKQVTMNIIYHKNYCNSDIDKTPTRIQDKKVSVSSHKLFPVNGNQIGLTKYLEDIRNSVSSPALQKAVERAESEVIKPKEPNWKLHD